MKIIAYELHVETHHSLGEIFTLLRNKALDVDLKLCEHHTKMVLKHQNGSIYEFEIKLYKEHSGIKVYEIKAYDELEMQYIRDIIESL